jgi:hypothetical protein
VPFTRRTVARFAAALVYLGAAFVLAACVRPSVCRERENAAFDMGEAHGRYMSEMERPCRDAKTGRYIKCSRKAQGGLPK